MDELSYIHRQAMVYLTISCRTWRRYVTSVGKEKEAGGGRVEEGTIRYTAPPGLQPIQKHHITTISVRRGSSRQGRQHTKERKSRIFLSEESRREKAKTNLHHLSTEHSQLRAGRYLYVSLRIIKKRICGQVRSALLRSGLRIIR